MPISACIEFKPILDYLKFWIPGFFVYQYPCKISFLISDKSAEAGNLKRKSVSLQIQQSVFNTGGK